MKGVISYIEKGSFQGKEGPVTFHSVICDGIKYTCFNKSIAEKKVGDEIEFEKVDKGEGKTPQMKLAGESSGKGNWKPQDPDGMYRCNASDKATQIYLAGIVGERSMQVWDQWYDHIYAKMKGESAPVSTPAVANAQTVAQNTTNVGSNSAAGMPEWQAKQQQEAKSLLPPKSTEGKTLASESQKNAIKNMAKARKMSTDDFLTESLGYGAPLEELSKGEASMSIGFWNKKDEQGEPF